MLTEGMWEGLDEPVNAYHYYESARPFGKVMIADSRARDHQPSNNNNKPKGDPRWHHATAAHDGTAT
ncbi:hypothetical protein ABN028_20425 [Actinopolymorpha sp. B17G11]|uniref:hypothetical protein n=1 Tax=Actinopolymorpha sp. B17G11 TaxID=3160861 RepID=UPI0032E38763